METLKNKILLGDCLEVMRSMPDKCVDLLLTDPPYGLNICRKKIGYAGFNTVQKKAWDEAIPTEEYFSEMLRVAKNAMLWGGNYCGMSSRCWLVWDKGEGSKDRDFAEAELAFTTFDANVRIFKYDPLAGRDYNGKIHPTQKPVPLFVWCLEQFAPPGALVFDPFSGSGTTAIACHNMGLDFICVEKDADYHAASVERLRKHRQQLLLPGMTAPVAVQPELF